MTWSDVFLICFLVGLVLSLVSFLGGSHFHLPHGMGHHAGLTGAPHHGTGRGTTLSPINFATVTAFLAWLSRSHGAAFRRLEDKVARSEAVDAAMADLVEDG